VVNRWLPLSAVNAGIAGEYRITRDDVLAGVRHEDAVARVTFGFDVHALSRLDIGYISATMRAVHDKSQPYDVPFRTLVARDVRGSLVAGRCLSGDFWAHSSYRVTGNAAATGEAAGVGAAVATASGRLPHELSFSEIADPLAKFRQTCSNHASSAWRVSVTGRRPPRRAGTAVSAATTSTVASTTASSCQSDGSVPLSLSPPVIAFIA